MSVVTVQLGQCGNQMGYHLFESLANSARAPSNTSSGQYFSSKAKDDYVQELIERYFHERLPPIGASAFSSSLEARAVLIDMESKVVDKVTEAASSAHRLNKEEGEFRWRFDAKRVFSRKRGSGNNWANGFLNYGTQCRDDIVDVVRKELESCESFQGFLLLMSLAGGTGSGLGTAVAEMLQDAFGGVAGKTSFCQAVWPHTSGEVILQNYNALLSIAHLSQATDAVMLQFNDVLHHICTKRLHLKRVGFSDMNRLIVHHLTSLLSPSWPVDLEVERPPSKPRQFQPKAPTNDASKRMDQRAARPKTSLPIIESAPTIPEAYPWVSGRKPTNTLTDLAIQLTPHPGYKLLQSYSVPVMAPNCLEYSRDHWHSLVKRLRQMLLTNFSIDEGLDWNIERQKRNRSLSNSLFLRGIDLDFCHVNAANEFSYDTDSEDAKRLHFKLLRDEDMYCPWTPSDSRFRCSASPFSVGGYEKSATLLSNCSAIAAPLDAVVNKAWKMFGAKAYLHQYETFGFGQDDFLDCFGTVEQIISNYKEI